MPFALDNRLKNWGYPGKTRRPSPDGHKAISNCLVDNPPGPNRETSQRTESVIAISKPDTKVQPESQIWSNPQKIFVLKPREPMTLTHQEDEHSEYSKPLVQASLKKHLPYSNIDYIEEINDLLDLIAKHFQNSLAPILIISQGLISRSGVVTNPITLAEEIRNIIPEKFHHKIKILVRSHEQTIAEYANEPMILGTLPRKPFYKQIMELRTLLYEHTRKQIEEEGLIDTNLVTTMNYEQYIRHQQHDTEHALAFLLDYLSETIDHLQTLPKSQRLSNGSSPMIKAQYLQLMHDELAEMSKKFFQAALSREIGQMDYCWETMNEILNRLSRIQTLLAEPDKKSFDLVFEEYRSHLQSLYLRFIGYSKQYIKHEIQLNDLVKRTQTRWENALNKSKISMEISNTSPGAIICSDWLALNSVLDNLIANAQKYLLKHPELAQKISLQFNVSKNSFHFTVNNAGSLDEGVNETTMFFHGKSSDADSKRNLSNQIGLGLSSARDICLALGGNLICQCSQNTVSLIGHIARN